ncbi:MAG TPA: cupin domain-containing protein [Bacillota bacterium]|nr:cupin domain-containing protein [Bacillota bacterium]
MAKVIDPMQLTGTLVSDAQAAGLLYRTLVAAGPGTRLSANLVTVAPGGVTRKHAHGWEQVNYIVSGKGTLVDGAGMRHTLVTGMVVHFLSDELHWFENDNSDDLVILGVLGPDAR